MPLPSIQQIAIIGFGEAGGIFGQDFVKQGIKVSVFDILLVSKRHRRQVLCLAVKMCRSVMLKGIEALAVECLFAARHYGVEDAVLESLAATYPNLGWKDRLPDYLISRVAEHGLRSHEMREVAQALRSVGVNPAMAMATAERQERLVSEMAERNLCFEASEPFSWRSLADAIARGGQRRTKRSF